MNSYSRSVCLQTNLSVNVRGYPISSVVHFMVVESWALNNAASLIPAFRFMLTSFTCFNINVTPVYNDSNNVFWTKNLIKTQPWNQMQLKFCIIKLIIMQSLNKSFLPFGIRGHWNLQHFDWESLQFSLNLQSSFEDLAPLPEMCLMTYPEQLLSA